MGHYNHSISVDAKIMVSKNCPIIGEHVGDKLGDTYSLSNYNKYDKMQPFAGFKKILWSGLRATLKFRKFKVALNLLHRMFLNFAKRCILACLC